MTGLGPLPPLAQVLRIVLTGQLNSMPWASVQHARYTGTTPTATDLNGVATAVTTAWANALAPAIGTNCSLTNVQVVDLTSNTSAEGAHASTTFGTHTNLQIANNSSCWVQSLNVNFRYRGGHPRIYWPATDANFFQAGRTFTGAAMALFNAAKDGWVGDINAIICGGAPLQHGAAFYYTHDPNTKARMYRNPPLFFPTTSTTVHQRIDTQRRRLGKEVP